jgi:hypothetical protein
MKTTECVLELGICRSRNLLDTFVCEANVVLVQYMGVCSQAVHVLLQGCIFIWENETLN